MSDKSRIEWTDATWNPVTGCSKVSQGCKNCYAERLWPKLEAAERMREHFEWQRAPKRPFTQVRCHENRLEQPLHWTRPRRIFVNSLSDLFHEDVPFEFIDQVFGTMAITTRHTYQILTKRHARMLEYIQSRTDLAREESGRETGLIGCPDVITDASVAALKRTNDRGSDNCGPLWPLQNVWLGVSVEDQDTADERIPLLLQTPAAVRFLSCEPLLGPVDIQAAMNAHMPRTGPVGDATPFSVVVEGRPIREHLHWVITGGESGPKARPTHPHWIRSLRDQCAAAGVAFFFKQWGEWLPICMTPTVNPNPGEDWYTGRKSLVLQLNGENEFALPPGAMTCIRMGKKAAGRELDGRTHDEYPA